MKPSTKALMWIWILAVIQLGIKSITTVCTAIQIATINTPWSQINKDTRFNIYVGLVILIGNHLYTFITNTVKEIKLGNDVPPADDNGDTQSFTNSQTQQQQQQKGAANRP